MSTYIHQRPCFQENITIDVDSGITVQKCQLLNNQNVYWGTFKGILSSDAMNQQLSAIAEAYALLSRLCVETLINEFKLTIVNALSGIDENESELSDVVGALVDLRNALSSDIPEPDEPDDEFELIEDPIRNCPSDDCCNGECPDPEHCACEM